MNSQNTVFISAVSLRKGYLRAKKTNKQSKQFSSTHTSLCLQIKIHYVHWSILHSYLVSREKIANSRLMKKHDTAGIQNCPLQDRQVALGNIRTAHTCNQNSSSTRIKTQIAHHFTKTSTLCPFMVRIPCHIRWTSLRRLQWNIFISSEVNVLKMSERRIRCTNVLNVRSKCL